MKKIIKYIIGYIKCKVNRISVEWNSKIYIGRKVKIIGGANIRLDKRTVIRPYVDLWCSGKAVEIGEGTEIGERSRISISNRLKIGEKVLISPNVYITDCDHEYRNIHIPVIEQGIVKKENSIEIKDHVYIGINSVIVGNITIGKGSVIGANSVVTKDIPDYCVAVGSPAKVIKKYDLKAEKWMKI